MTELERREREYALQNRFGPIVGISDLSDGDFERMEKAAREYEAHRSDWRARVNALSDTRDKG
jgi:hypothetical protein